MTPIEIESKRFTENVDNELSHVTTCDCLPCSECPRRDGGEYFATICIEGEIFRITRPTYTIELVRSELERKGKWEGFVIHAYEYNECGYPVEQHWNMVKNFADILTTPLYFLQAANGYFDQEREDAAYQTQQVRKDR